MIYQSLNDYLSSCRNEFHRIPAERKEMLEALGEYIRRRDEVSVTFICTHNSRRSHLGQVWMKVAAEFTGLGDRVHTFSGGTEATACNPRTVAALERAGFHAHNPGEENPHWQLHYSENKSPVTCYSKRYDDVVNPSADFAAVMTCSEADEACPLIPGADLRLPLTYDDPKASDGTDQEAEVYDERCRQIATEMLYAADSATS